MWALSIVNLFCVCTSVNVCVVSACVIMSIRECLCECVCEFMYECLCTCLYVCTYVRMCEWLQIIIIKQVGL